MVLKESWLAKRVLSENFLAPGGKGAWHAWTLEALLDFRQNFDLGRV